MWYNKGVNEGQRWVTAQRVCGEVAISSDKTLGWSDKTGHCPQKVEDKKNPTPQKNLLTNSTKCGIMKPSRGEPRRRKHQALWTTETEANCQPIAMKSISLGEAIQGAVRLMAGNRNKPEKWRVAEIMKKVRNFFRKPLDKPLKVWYNKGNTTEMAGKTRNETLSSA